MAAQWVQQYEEQGRLINKYVDDETGVESFEDAGPVQQAQPEPAPAAAYVPPYDPGPSPTALWGMAQYGQPEANPPPHSNPVQIAPNGAVTYDNTGITYEATQPSMPVPANAPRPAAPTAPDPYAKLLADNAARQAANDAAELAYRNAVLQGQRDDRALAAAQQAWSQKFSEEKFKFEQTQAQNSTALGVLGLGLQARGPSNYLSYLRTLSGTPGGLKDAVNALAGRYGLSSMQGSVPGSQYERQSLGTLVRDLNNAPANANDASGIDLPAGNQWNAANFNVLSKNPTQIGLLQNLYDESGRDFSTEYSNFLSSLPRYSGARAARVQI